MISRLHNLPSLEVQVRVHAPIHVPAIRTALLGYKFGHNRSAILRVLLLNQGSIQHVLITFLVNQDWFQDEHSILNSSPVLGVGTKHRELSSLAKQGPVRQLQLENVRDGGFSEDAQKFHCQIYLSADRKPFSHSEAGCRCN